jgi:hypothetical protein
MKKLLLMFVAVLAILIFVATVGAQGGLTYDTGFQVQNLDSSSTANIVITYYNKDGTVNTNVPDTITAGKSKTYFPIDASAGFDGSAVISSDTAVAAITNVLGNGSAFGASYGGLDQGAQVVALPLIMKQNSGFSTWFNVQNAGASDATVNVSYAGTACTETKTIKPGAAGTFDQATNSCLPSGYVGSAKVDAGTGGSVAATVMQVGSTTLFAYNGFTGGDPNPVIPLVNANNSGFITGIQIQNTGSSPTNVTVSYTPVSGGGTACTETQSVPANNSSTFALNAFTFGGAPSTTCALGAKFVGSAEVTTNSANADLVSIVNQLNLGTNKGSSYNAFVASQATDEVVMPLIMDRNSGFYTGFNVQNVGSGNTVVTCNFASNDGSVTGSVSSPSLSPGDAFNDLQQNNLASGFVGSAVCNATGSVPIIGVVNELGSGSGDQLFTYEGFNN